MHSTQAPGGTVFHHHGDFSGEVIFAAPAIDTGASFVGALPFGALAAAAVTAQGPSVTLGVHGGGVTSLEVRGGSLLMSPGPGAAEVSTVTVPTADLRFLIACRVRWDRQDALERECDDRVGELERADVDTLWALGAGTEIARWAAEADATVD